MGESESETASAAWFQGDLLVSSPAAADVSVASVSSLLLIAGLIGLISARCGPPL
jgi:hypothetical protein